MANRRQRTGGGSGGELSTSEAAVRVRHLLMKFDEMLSNDEIKITAADYMRAIQMSRELEPTHAQRLEVAWIEKHLGDEPAEE